MGLPIAYTSSSCRVRTFVSAGRYAHGSGFYRYHIPHGIAPQYLSGDFQPVSEDDLDAFRLLNHVLVCQQIPRPTDDEFRNVALP